MTISPIAAAQAQPSAQSAATADAISESASSLISSDFETFLTMMTTQARYQDPLEPMDSSDYASQLAQFSMVEQQVKNNDLLEALSAALQTTETNVSSLSGWIGMDALSYAPANFTGEPITIAPNPLASADEVKMVVYNEAGKEVQRLSIPLSPEPVDWLGVAQLNGTKFPEGNYSFEIESYQGGTLQLVERAQTYSKINEARIEDGQTILILEGGLAVLSSDVTGLRDGSL